MRKEMLLRAALLLLPTLILAGWALSLPLLRAAEPVMRVRLAGFDPRDLLRGHYLLARLDIAGLPPGRAGAGDCVCLTPGGADGRPGFTALPACTPDVLSSCAYPLADPGRELRLYQSQERAVRLEALLRDAKVRVDVAVRFDGQGGIALEDIQVDGKSLPETE